MSMDSVPIAVAATAGFTVGVFVLGAGGVFVLGAIGVAKTGASVGVFVLGLGAGGVLGGGDETAMVSETALSSHR